MINKDCTDSILDPKKNILHSSENHNLVDLFPNTYSKNEFNNLVLNLNLDAYNTIK